MFLCYYNVKVKVGHPALKDNSERNNLTDIRSPFYEHACLKITHVIIENN